MKRKHNLTKISNISWTIEKIVIFIVLNFFPPQKQKAEKNWNWTILGPLSLWQHSFLRINFVCTIVQPGTLRQQKKTNSEKSTSKVQISLVHDVVFLSCYFSLCQCFNRAETHLTGWIRELMKNFGNVSFILGKLSWNTSKYFKNLLHINCSVDAFFRQMCITLSSFLSVESQMTKWKISGVDNNLWCSTLWFNIQ